jgi:hypothetical protein
MPQSPTIDNLTEQPLSYEFEQVFEEMFPDYERVVIRSEFTGGLSGGRVFLVRPVSKKGAERPSVVKIDETERIEREWRSYQDCIQNRLGEAAEIRGEPVYPRGSQWGGLWYPSVGSGTFDVVSLQQYYRTAPVTDIQHVLEKRLFQSLETLWKDNRKVEVEYFLQGRYDAILPSNLVISKAAAAGNGGAFLRPESIRTQKVKPGDAVQLFGFRIIKVNRSGKQLSLNTPENSLFAYRIELQDVDDINRYRVGQMLQQPVGGVVQQTRADLLLAEARKIFGDGVDFAAATLPTTHHATLPNPLVSLPQVLSRSLDVEVGYIHGDLNLENVLVEPENRNAFLIDFALSRKDHILHDPLRMELAVITKLLPELFQQTGQSAEQVISFYERLHCAVQQPEKIGAPDGLEKPFAILQMIRRVAQPHLHRTNQWSEYYYGLVVYLIGSLRFSDLDTLSTTPLPKQMAFWGAAAILRLLQEPPNCDAFPTSNATLHTTSVVTQPKIQPLGGPTTNFYGPVTGSIHTGSGNINATTEHKTETSSAPTRPAPRYQEVERVTVLKILRESFNHSELSDLCLGLGVDYDDLSGSSKADKARELLLYCERRGLGDRLVRAIHQERPTAF